MTSKHPLKQINILVIAKSVDGGTGTYVLDILSLNGYSNRRYSLKIKTVVLEKPQYRPKRNFSVDSFFHKKKYPSYYKLTIKNLVGFYKELMWFRNKTKKFPPQVILSVDLHANLLAIVTKLLFLKKTKVIATSHINLVGTLLTKSNSLARSLLYFLVWLLYPRADKLIGVSDGISRNLKKNFILAKKIATVYNGIDSNLKASVRDLVKTDTKIIISVSRLDNQKDLEGLIKVFNNLQKDHHLYKLWILGDGPMRGDLEKLVDSYQLKDKVVFLGWRDDVDRYLSMADLFVLSSKREGMPYALLEAMKHGLPVVATNTPYGPSEILGKGKYGALVPMGRLDVMQRKIILLLSNARKYSYFSKKSIERHKKFSKVKMIGTYRKIISRLIKE